MNDEENDYERKGKKKKEKSIIHFGLHYFWLFISLYVYHASLLHSNTVISVIDLSLNSQLLKSKHSYYNCQ